ncbi:MAG: Do family serine endopeptidase [Lewinellaceae bacterium]|nr:Do family serine endopeptidase [Lewinellaceae bacterium]
MKKFGHLILAAVLGAALALGGAQLINRNQPLVLQTAGNAAATHFTNLAGGNNAFPAEGFSATAERALPSVVHIRASSRVRGGNSMFDGQNLPDAFRYFFGDPGRNGRQQEDRLQEGTGSGVIISPDGYIVTNNHVVQDAETLEVTLNDKRVIQAKVIGTDPSTDVALIKIEAENLPALAFANSDAVRVGEWVVAVGNPFNLASTVTAGIISAKGRNINILEGQSPIESFIQTDAVVNPGNSGGALVNINGDLIGMNTAIASPTGVFAGYAFAVPSNLVAKVVADLKAYGVVQRGYLGAMIIGIDGRFAKERKLPVNEGVYVDSLVAGGAAMQAGVQVGDIIQEVNGTRTNTSPELLDQIGRQRPGDKVTLKVLRKGATKELVVTLKNKAGNTDLVKKADAPEKLEALGAAFTPLTKEELRQLGVNSGLKVSELRAGVLANQTDIREGFIITRVDRQPVNSVKDLEKALDNKEGGVLLEGIYPGSDRMFYYGIGLL